MKKTRFIRSLIAVAKDSEPQMPWMRATGRSKPAPIRRHN